MKTRKLWIVAVLALAAACSSAPPSRPPQQPQAEAAQAPQKAKAEDSIVVRKGDRSKTEASYLDRTGNENISIDVKNADLKTVILPIFKNQAGVWLEYDAKALPKKIAQLTIRDLHYRDALGVLCYMTRMHLVRVEGSRALEIKEGYEDPGRILEGWRPDKVNGPAVQTRYGIDPVAERPPEPTTAGAYGGSQGGGSAPAGGGGEMSGMQDPSADVGNSRGAQQIDTLRRTVSTTNSGAR